MHKKTFINIRKLVSNYLKSHFPIFSHPKMPQLAVSPWLFAPSHTSGTRLWMDVTMVTSMAGEFYMLKTAFGSNMRNIVLISPNITG